MHAKASLQGKVKAASSVWAAISSAPFPIAAGSSRLGAACDLTVQIATKLNRSPSVPWRSHLFAAVPRPHRNRPTSERPASRFDRRLHRVHSRLARSSASLPVRTCVRTEHRRGVCQGHAGRQILGYRGTRGLPTMPAYVMRSRRPIRTSFTISTNVCGSRRISDRPLPARERSGRRTPARRILSPLPHSPNTPICRPTLRHVLQLITLRSNGQFNTTIYSNDDKFRGVHGTRDIVFMHRNDIDRLGLREGQSADARLRCAGRRSPRGRWIARHALLSFRKGAAPAITPNALR